MSFYFALVLTTMSNGLEPVEPVPPPVQSTEQLIAERRRARIEETKRRRQLAAQKRVANRYRGPRVVGYHNAPYSISPVQANSNRRYYIPASTSCHGGRRSQYAHYYRPCVPRVVSISR